MSLCPCFDKVNVKLSESGLQLSKKLFAFSLANLDLDMHLHLPLERIDHKRLKSSDGKTLRIVYCPFCGRGPDPETKLP